MHGFVLRRTMTAVDFQGSATWSMMFYDVEPWELRIPSLKGETVRVHRELSCRQR